MYVRLGFAIAINMDPDILLVDEILAVGDAAFQEKCMDKFADFRKAGKTVVIVSHAMGSLRSMCDHAVWLEQGKMIEDGKATRSSTTTSTRATTAARRTTSGGADDHPVEPDALGLG